MHVTDYVRNLNTDPVVPSHSDEYERGVMDAEYDVSVSYPVEQDWFLRQSVGYQQGYHSVTPYADMNWKA